MAQTTTSGTADTVRGELARRRIRGRDLARELGWPERTFRRRLSGETPFTVDELVAIARFLDMSVASLIAGDSPSLAP